MSYWGYHMIVNARNCTNAIRSAEAITKFSNQLVKKIDMVPYGQPQVVMFGTGNKKGYTLVQLIETSNICAHFVEETNDMYLDVFSCKTFCPRTVEHMIQQSFGPEHVDYKVISRDARQNLTLS
jgi:S-adenosylmethionine decarboxylase